MVLGFVVATTVGEAANAEWLAIAPGQMVRSILFGPFGMDTLLIARTEFLRVETSLSTGEGVVVWRGVPDAREWGMATLLWICVGLLGLWAAAWRHNERHP